MAIWTFARNLSQSSQIYFRRRSKSASLKAMEVKQGEEAAEEPRSHQDGSGFYGSVFKLWFKMVKYGLRFYTHR